MPRKLAILFMSLATFAAHGADTPCASRVFADALAQTANAVDETAHETDH